MHTHTLVFIHSDVSDSEGQDESLLQAQLASNDGQLAQVLGFYKTAKWGLLYRVCCVLFVFCTVILKKHGQNGNITMIPTNVLIDLTFGCIER